MNLRIHAFWLIVFSVIITSFVSGQNPQGTMTYTVSMDQPSTHYYHVDFHSKGIKADSLNFKMPVWTPGYYWIRNFSREVLNFRAENGSGIALAWKKTTKNTWLVKTENAKDIEISYDVYAFTQSVADPFLDDGRGFISPAGIFMYVDGYFNHPVTVTVKPYKNWSKISTGLEPVVGSQDTFLAGDFDVLYDCPILAGNQEVLTFKVQGIQHYIAIENPGSFDREKFISKLKQIVEQGSAIIGEIPYRHYTFIIMSEGRGGLEHRNSMAVYTSSTYYNTENPDENRKWLSFLAHEYFHLYNVKLIHPVGLGPFDYDRENYTEMLWMSEGFTVYYEYLILNRAGLMTRNEAIDEIRNNIMDFENIPGHLFQSAGESSFDTWIQFFNREPDVTNRSISYYDKGCVIGMLMDLKIRWETKNKKSLDDVMRALYQQYTIEKGRGFTDSEFRDVCETVAGCSLSELFAYATTVDDIDYKKYFSYAGLDIDLTIKELLGSSLGAVVSEQASKPVIRGVEWDSPAWHYGLSVQDTILMLDDINAGPETLDELLNSKKPGDTLNVVVSRRSGKQELEVILGRKTKKDFKITPLSNPDSLQSEISKSWLKE